jgi:catechol 2,3-dioxygenase-like lactoylglutathione lyase family enzyme
MNTRLHHVGGFVEDFEAAVAFYDEAFDADLLSIETIEGKLQVAFMRLPTHEVHLLAREGRGIRADAILDELEPYRYHVAYEVPDVERAIDAVREAGCVMFHDEPIEAELRPWRRAFSEPSATPWMPFELLERVGEEPAAFRVE